jgi:STE24 endopeptidase
MTLSSGAEASALMFSGVFVGCLALSLVFRLWLMMRQSRHVARHRHVVPAAFAQSISLSAHQRAAAYTEARLRLALLEAFVQAAWLIVLTMMGGLQWLISVTALLPPGWDLTRSVVLMSAVLIVGGLIDLPFAWWRQFRLEERFGFNRMTPGLFLADLIKSTLIGAVLGLPLLVAILAVMDAAGSTWWIWAWLIWITFNVVVLLVFPTFIAPLFNRFEPLPEGAVRDRVQALLVRTGFSARGLFVMDGSRRSAHGNAYFTGFGRARRIVFFDTLLNQLDADEIEAVLAHELGHFRLRHLQKRLLMLSLGSFLALAALGWLAQQPWFYLGLGIVPDQAVLNACALILFMIVAPVFLFPMGPVASALSRRDEFAADAFAAQATRAEALASALTKLYRDNAAPLSSDPIYSAMHDSHPPALQRISQLLATAHGS